MEYWRNLESIQQAIGASDLIRQAKHEDYSATVSIKSLTSNTRSHTWKNTFHTNSETSDDFNGYFIKLF